jgi:rfaE bifunctional protein nucleotidyltransferase chain/domain
MDKIVDPGQAQALSKQYKDQGKTIVFTNGCFDILHAGHVGYLNHAAAFGQVLILGVNSDRSVKQIKGEKRPIIEQSQRAAVVSGLACVDHVVFFDEPDPGRLIETITPDVLVKGADWPEEQIIGADFVKANGGRIERIVFEHDISTTKIIQKIGQLYYGKE